MRERADTYWMADLYGELQLAPAQERRRWLDLLPGLVVAGTAAFAALWLSDQYGAPSILMGLLLGFALNFASADDRLLPGLNLCSQTLLRIGIVLLGFRITFAEVASLGIWTFVGLVGLMVAVILVGVLAARMVRLDAHFGLLAGGATAICGISAALALWSIIGSRRVDQEQFAIVVLGTTIASAIALTFYPALAALAGLDDTQAGFLIGSSIHDVAQAIGGGFAFSDKAGEVATVVKLSRVTLLVPLLLAVTILLRGSGGAAGSQDDERSFSLRQGVPWFIAGFALLVVINSLVEVPEIVGETGMGLASFFLLLAVTAAAMKSNLSGLLANGLRSFVPVITTTLTAFALAFGLTQIL